MKYNLLSVIRRKKYYKYGQAVHKYPNLINGDFHADKHNQKWVTDISYIHMLKGVMYLSVICDLFHRGFLLCLYNLRLFT